LFFFVSIFFPLPGGCPRRQYHDYWKAPGSREFDGTHSGGKTQIHFSSSSSFRFQWKKETTSTTHLVSIETSKNGVCGGESLSLAYLNVAGPCILYGEREREQAGQQHPTVPAGEQSVLVNAANPRLGAMGAMGGGGRGGVESIGGEVRSAGSNKDIFFFTFFFLLPTPL
jgi:hypothetical protein